MFKKLTVLVCLVSLAPAAAGAQDVALLTTTAPAAAEASAAGNQPAREVDLSPPLRLHQDGMVVAENDSQQKQMTGEEERPRRTHEGLTFKEFVDIHFGGHRWIYWAVAAAALIGLHVAVAR
jgi:hypothetical protein